MFWFEFRKTDGTTYVSSAEGQTPGERQRAIEAPEFVREFQGDKFGRDYAKAGAR